ncbi:MAG: hypothetical protein ACRD8O_17350 [Bryobacteraceae bacterium]
MKCSYLMSGNVHIEMLAARLGATWPAIDKAARDSAGRRRNLEELFLQRNSTTTTALWRYSTTASNDPNSNIPKPTKTCAVRPSGTKYEQ